MVSSKQCPPTKDRGLLEGYRSGLEKQIGAQLEAIGIHPQYEEHSLKYLKPAETSTYTPDFILPNGIVVETKGRFVAADRKKHLLVKQSHPQLDIRFVFSNPNAKINKGSPTSYAMWCNRNGFLYSAKSIPQEWIEEPVRAHTMSAAKEALNWKPAKEG